MAYSHIIIPRAILKNFSTKKNIYYIKKDTDSIILKKDDVKEIGGKEEYFSKETEDYLNQTNETKLRAIIKEIKKFKYGIQNNLNESDFKILVSYFNNCYIRNPKIQNEISNNIGIKISHDYLVQNIQCITKSYNDCSLLILINKTNYNFLLPSNGYYFDYDLNPIVPLSKEICIAFVKRQLDRIIYKTLYDESITYKLNKIVMNDFYNTNNIECVYGTKKELENWYFKDVNGSIVKIKLIDEFNI